MSQARSLFEFVLCLVALLASVAFMTWVAHV